MLFIGVSIDSLCRLGHADISGVLIADWGTGTSISARVKHEHPTLTLLLSLLT